MRPEFSGHQAGLFPVKLTPPWSACAVMNDPEARPTQPQRHLRSASTSMPSPSAGSRSLASVVSPVVQASIVAAVSAWVPHSVVHPSLTSRQRSGTSVPSAVGGALRQRSPTETTVTVVPPLLPLLPCSYHLSTYDGTEPVHNLRRPQWPFQVARAPVRSFAAAGDPGPTMAPAAGNRGRRCGP